MLFHCAETSADSRRWRHVTIGRRARLRNPNDGIAGPFGVTVSAQKHSWSRAELRD